MAEGSHWEVQRRFTLRKLRDFGFAKSAMESLISEETTSMLHWFDKRLNQPISGNRIFNGPVVNSLWRIMSGEKEEWDSPQPPKILTYTGGIAGYVDNYGTTFIFIVFIARIVKMIPYYRAVNRMTESGLYFAPILRHIAPTFLGWTGWVNNLANLNNTLLKAIERHATNLDPNSPQ